MNKNFSKLIAIGLLVGGACRLAAHDLIVPCWRGQPDSTYQEWNFASGSNPAAPERSTNAYGTASAAITPGAFADGYYSDWPNSTNVGFWDMGQSGTINVQVPNRPGSPAASCKYVWVQVAQYIAGFPFANYATVSIPGATYLGGQRVLAESVPPFGGFYVDQTMWRLEPNPASETITITSSATGGAIDAIVVDSICLTNSNTYVDAAYSGSDCSSVGWPNAVAPLDKPLGLLAFQALQTGLDRAPSNGIVNVAGGSYTALTVAKPLTVKLGAPTAQATVPGLTLPATATLAMDVNGTTAGSGYDQWVVNGNVTLGGTLALASGAPLAVGNTVTLINNAGANPVSGTFAGLPEGATNLVNGQQFKISYIGGSGNDVVLTMVNHAPIPGAKFATTTQNIAASIYLQKLLGAATDPDLGDLITFVAPVSLSASNGVVVTNILDGVPALTYTPPLNFVGTDYVYYTITDGKALSIGTITVTVNPGTGITFNMLPLVISNNLPFVQFAGVRGLTYDLQRSPNLSNWVTITTISLPANGNGIGAFYDTGAPNTNAFYRTHLP